MQKPAIQSQADSLPHHKSPGQPVCLKPAFILYDFQPGFAVTDQM